MTGSRRLAAAALLGALALSGCASDPGDSGAEPPRGLRVEVVRTAPHDRGSFTQGLEISGTELLESTGLSGESWMSATDLTTGVERVRADLAAPLFGEGITVADDEVWQLTWRDGVAVVRDRDTLTERRRVPLDGEGWGICALDDALVTSNGSSTLTFRDRDTFEVRRSVEATAGGLPVGRLNELECAEDGHIYANVWPTDTVARIDPVDGRTVTIDASELRTLLPADAAQDIDVLNGIAQIPGTDRFLLTGKYWPRLFEVRFVEATGPN